MDIHILTTWIFWEQTQKWQRILEGEGHFNNWIGMKTELISTAEGSYRPTPHTSNYWAENDHKSVCTLSVIISKHMSYLGTYNIYKFLYSPSYFVMLLPPVYGSANVTFYDRFPIFTPPLPTVHWESAADLSNKADMVTETQWELCSLSSTGIKIHSAWRQNKEQQWSPTASRPNQIHTSAKQT